MRWDEAFANAFGDSFAEGMRLAMYKKMAAERQARDDIHYDASLGVRGYRRLTEQEAKKYLQAQAANGVGVDSNAPLEQYDDGNVIRLGNNMFYQYDKNLAMKMRGKQATQKIDLNELQADLQKKGLMGRVLPNIIRAGGTGEPEQTYKYYPSIEESQGLATEEPAIQAPKVARTPDEVLKMRTAISNAVKSGASRDELLQGITSEGFDANDFSDILYDYDPNIPPMRRQFLGNTVRKLGVGSNAALGIIGTLSGRIDQIKKRLSGSK